MPYPYSRNFSRPYDANPYRLTWYRYQAGNRTARGERREPWAYRLEESWISPQGGAGWFVYPSANTSELMRDIVDPTAGPAGNRSWQHAVDSAHNKARARFKEKVRNASSVQIGETVAQAGDMLGLAAKRATQLGTGIMHLRKGNLRKFFATFGLPSPVDKRFRPMVAKHLRQRQIKTPPSWEGADRWAVPSPNKRWEDRSTYHWAQRRLKAKDPASVWLEYWFVWSPTVSDFHGTIKVLANSSPPHGQTVRATATSRLSYRQDYPYYWGELFKISYGGELKATTLIQGTVTCINPNRQLYDTLGISNIPLVLWWATPFSFLVDWVANVSELLDSFQDTMDWILNESFVTNYRRTASSDSTVSETGFYSYKSQYSGTPSELYKAQCVYMTRQVGVGIPEVRLIIALPKFSLTRAATAISLLASQLKSI